MPGFDSSLQGVDGSANVRGAASQARQVMQRYADDACGGQFARCPPVTLNVPVASALDQQVGAALLAMWRAALPGYPVAFTQQRDTSSPDAAPQLSLGDWRPNYPHPQAILSASFLPGSPRNLGHVDEPDVTAWLEAADAASSETNALPLYQHAEQQLVIQVGAIPLVQFTTSYLMRSYILGYAVTALGYPTLSQWMQVSHPAVMSCHTTNV